MLILFTVYAEKSSSDTVAKRRNSSRGRFSVGNILTFGLEYGMI